MNHKEIISQGASAWSRLTDDQKLPYNQKYEAEKEKYNVLLQNMVCSLVGHIYSGQISRLVFVCPFCILLVVITCVERTHVILC